MVPKIHKKGSSFKGAAAYLLHDKGSREKNDRVEWTTTRNLATNNPEAAWRVMAATAMDGERRKALAGIRATGRKSKDSVLHLTLSWHPDEAKGLTRPEMMRAAEGAVKALGAEKHQALLVSHNDEPQPHVHILINRVSAEDGRMLSSSKEKLALSAWAQDYEKGRGRVLCPVRVENNARRRHGQFIRGTPDQPRHVYEQPIKATQPRSVEAGKRLSTDERKRDAALALKQREMRTRHSREWIDLEERHKAERSTLRHKVRELFPRYKLVIEKKYISWKDSFDQKQRRQFGEFAGREKKILGRVVNGFSTIDFDKLLRNQNGERKLLRDSFKCLVSSSARMDAFKAQLKRERREAEKKHNEQTFKMQGRIFAGWRVRRVRVHQTFGQQRHELFKQQEKERAEMKTLWNQRHDERKENCEKIRKLDRLEKPAAIAPRPPARQQTQPTYTVTYLSEARAGEAPKSRQIIGSLYGVTELPRDDELRKPAARQERTTQQPPKKKSAEEIVRPVAVPAEKTPSRIIIPDRQQSPVVIEPPRQPLIVPPSAEQQAQSLKKSLTPEIVRPPAALIVPPPKQGVIRETFSVLQQTQTKTPPAVRELQPPAIIVPPKKGVIRETLETLQQTQTKIPPAVSVEQPRQPLIVPPKQGVIRETLTVLQQTQTKIPPAVQKQEPEVPAASPLSDAARARIEYLAKRKAFEERHRSRGLGGEGRGIR